MVVHASFGRNAHRSGGLDRIHIGPQEKELPALLPAAVDHSLDRIQAEFLAGILQPVSGDDEQRLFRTLVLQGMGLGVFHFGDGTAYCIQQSGAAPHIIFLGGDIRNAGQGNPVVEQFVAIVKENRGHDGLAGFLALLVQQSVVAAHSVAFQSPHGTAAIQNKYQFCQILLHNKALRFVVFCFAVTTGYHRRAFFLSPERGHLERT